MKGLTCSFLIKSSSWYPFESHFLRPFFPLFCLAGPSLHLEMMLIFLNVKAKRPKEAEYTGFLMHVALVWPELSNEGHQSGRGESGANNVLWSLFLKMYSAVILSHLAQFVRLYTVLTQLSDKRDTDQPERGAFRASGRGRKWGDICVDCIAGEG